MARGTVPIDRSQSNHTKLFRLVAWNIRAGGGQRWAQILQALVRLDPDCVVLSEFRSTPPSQWLAQGLAQAGLRHQTSTTQHVGPGVNALLIASRLAHAKVPLRNKPTEPGRWQMIRLAQPRIAIAGMHIPNQHTGRKPAFHNEVRSLTQRWRGGAAILAGDTNSGRIGEDEETAVFNQATHQWFDDIHQAGWRDAFRERHGTRREFTWYSPGHDNGFRLDQAFVSPDLAAHINHVEHAWLPHPEQPTRRDGLSDHAALVLDIDYPI